MKLLLTDAVTIAYQNDIALDVFEQFGNVTSYESISRDELLKIVKDYDVILTNKVVIDREVIEKAVNLKYIGLFATGYNNIDIEYAKEKGIAVCNAGSYSTSAVAQQVFAYILSQYSAVEKYNQLVQKGGWITSPTFSMLCCPTDELYGKTLGIIGFGSIGKRVAEIAKAFEMNVLCYTRTAKQADGISFVSFDELLSKSDIVSPHCPLNEQSKHLFNDETFSKMKDGAYFINTARGGVVDEIALLKALKSGKLSGAAIDVLDTEPMKADCVLLGAPNLIITPHTAWAPLATRQRLLDIVVDNLKCFINGKKQNRIV
ncbi:MAG: D-2-hydroxyacid dehydrogenase [Ruminococcaceae bacterium]|nr:D-2-hydroxyacid dehydrogenase [Oscillospiraceae bacterium]